MENLKQLNFDYLVAIMHSMPPHQRKQNAFSLWVMSSVAIKIADVLLKTVSVCLSLAHSQNYQTAPGCERMHF